MLNFIICNDNDNKDDDLCVDVRTMLETNVLPFHRKRKCKLSTNT